jgi:glycosyltransferase involved in cell wall biosynthesis
MIVDVILPCLNEAPALPWILGRMPAGFRPIVVDNCSTDGSGEVARSLGATVVPESARGFGTAAHAGLHVTGQWQHADRAFVCAAPRPEGNGLPAASRP